MNSMKRILNFSKTNYICTRFLASIPVKKKLTLNRQRNILDEALRHIENKYGKGVVMKMNSNTCHENIKKVSTGSIGLDQALGIGGLPYGRIVEIYGPESSGKTTLALSVIAQAQKEGKLACFIDAEHALDSIYAKKLGVDLNELMICQPNSGEEALDVTDNLVRGGVNVIVIDSVAALVPKAEIAGEVGDHHIALQARLMSQACRKLTATMVETNTLIIFINQIRHKVGLVFGSPEVTTGGMALKFYSSVRLDIRRIAQIKNQNSNGEIIGTTVRVKVAKNKLAAPFKIAEFDMEFGKGISKMGELIDIGLKIGIITKNGSWYMYNGRNISQGRENAKRYLQENKEIADIIENKIRESFSTDTSEKDKKD